MIDNYFKTTFTNYRQGGYVNGKSVRVEVGNFVGHLQQPSAELIERIGKSFTNTFTLWCDVNVDIKAGDDLEDSDGHTYSVSSINKRNYGGKHKHLEIFIERNDS